MNYSLVYWDVLRSQPVIPSKVGELSVVVCRNVMKEVVDKHNKMVRRPLLVCSHVGYVVTCICRATGYTIHNAHITKCAVVHATHTASARSDGDSRLI